MKSAKLSEKAYATFMFLAVSLLAGVLLSGVAVPFVAMASGGARAAVGTLDYLPAEFDTPEQSQRSRILMANGDVLSTFFDENRIYVPLDQISQEMQDAQIAIEDHRFYEHGAIDFEGLGRAFFKTISGDTQGASTLTQQYVKMVRVESAKVAGDEEAARAAVEVSIERKIQEARYAFAVEENFTKDEILERYLNIAYYGNGAYGVEAAARTYFDVSASELTLDQAALLAGLVQNPVGYDPVRQTKKATDRRNLVLQRMAETGFITQADADAAKQIPFDPEKVSRTPNGCVASKYPFLCDYVYETLVGGEVAGLGETREERINTLRRGGLTIRTLIDPKTQDAAQAAVSELVSPTDPIIANTVILEPSTGLIVAMAQSRPVMGDNIEAGETWWNYNVASDKGGAAGYQSGSTMKVFTAAAALEQGMAITHSYNSPGQLPNQDGETYKNCSGPFPFRTYGKPWAPANLGYRSYGNIDMKRATESSVNTYYVQLIQDAGICASIDMALKTGVELANKKVDVHERYQNAPSWVLGTAEVTPLSMAEGYATFANRGIHCEPRILESITRESGEEIEVPSGNCEQVIEPEVADGMNYLLESVMFNGTGRPAALRDGRPQAGKTGTTQENQAVWFAGYTPEMAGVAMIAVDTDPNRPTVDTLRGLRLANGEWLQGTGGGDAGQIWRAAMGTALEGKPETEFVPPTDRIMEGKKVPVPDVSGMSYSEAERTIEAAGFNTRRWGVYSSRPAGTFLGASPSSEAPMFSTITLRVSVGPRPKPDPQPTSTPDETPSPPADNDGGGNNGDNGRGNSGDNGRGNNGNNGNNGDNGDDDD